MLLDGPHVIKACLDPFVGNLETQTYSMQVLAVIPPEAIRHALGLATRGDRPLNYIEQGQIVLLVSAVRVKFGGCAISLGIPDISASPHQLKVLLHRQAAP